MGMKNGLLIIFLLFLVSAAATSQVNKEGAPIVRWFDAMETPGDLQNWCITMDNRGVMYFGNEREGIITYDGNTWSLIRMPGEQRINALETDHKGVVYVGGSDDFGFLQPNDRGELFFHSLADRMTDSLARGEVSMIHSIAADTNRVFFSDKRKLYIYDTEDDDVTVIDMNKDFNLRNAGRILVRDGRVIIADNREGLFELTEGALKQIPGGDGILRVLFVALIPYDKESIIIVTSDAGIFLFNLVTGELNRSFISSDLNSRLKSDHISGAVKLPGKRFAVGVTSGEGIYIFGHDGTLQQQISSETTDLPESTVTAMYCDHASNSQLWFCTNGYINRAYVSLPVNEFRSGSTLGEICEFNGSLYLSYDHGLYRSFTDSANRYKFEKLEGIDSKVYKLLRSKTPDGEVLLATTINGLYQIDDEGDVSLVLDKVYVTALKSDKDAPATLLTGTADGIIRTIKYSSGEWNVTNVDKRAAGRGMVMAIEQSAVGEWWVLTSDPCSLYHMECNATDTALVLYDRSKGLASDTLNYIVTAENSLYVCTAKGLLRYNAVNDYFEKDFDLIGDSFRDTQIHRILKTGEGDIVVSGYDTRHFDALVTPTRQGHVIFRRQFDFLPDVSTADLDYIDGNIRMVKGRSLFIIDKSKLGYGYGSFRTVFTNVTAGTDTVLMNGLFYTTSKTGTRIPSLTQPDGTSPSLKYSQNDISFSWTTTSYVEEEKTVYRYMLDGYDRDWSGWEKRNLKDFTNLPYGDYIFRLRAKTITGPESEEMHYSFSIRKPLYATIGALVIYSLLVIMLGFLFIRFYTRRLRNEYVHLEGLARQRTAEVGKQKAELDASIHYASRIQRALLSSWKLLADKTQNYFILFKPRDIVSGDFYWIARKEERLFIVVGDCTGHGVPGAFMSLLGISLLDEIVNKLAFKKAGHILNELRKQVIASLKQPGEPDEQKDGMDLALIIFDYKTRMVEFAGAYNPCFKVRAMNEDEIRQWERGEFEPGEGSLSNGRHLLETVNASRMPIGISTKMNQDFTQREWKIENDFSYYLFTDGYVDQFNGVTGRKFMKKNFKKLILDVQDYPMKKQQEILEERLKSWMGSSPQIDDILVLGLKAE